MPRPAAALFDLDGTLIDTEALCNATGVETCVALGLDVPPAFFETLAGIHDAERMRLIAARAGQPVDAEEFYAIWDRLTAERMALDLPLKPGAHDLLERLAGQGLPMALVTSSRRGPAADKLRVAGLTGFFDAVITVDDVAHAKPAPDPYQAGARALGQVPADCVAFEDSEPGAASARAAGCLVVQIPDLHGTEGAHADILATSLLDGAAKAGLI